MVKKIFGRLLPTLEPMSENAVDSLLDDPNLLFLARDMHALASMAEQPGSYQLGQLVVQCADRAAELRQIYDLDPDQMDMALATAFPVWREGEL